MNKICTLINNTVPHVDFLVFDNSTMGIQMFTFSKVGWGCKGSLKLAQKI